MISHKFFSLSYYNLILFLYQPLGQILTLCILLYIMSYKMYLEGRNMNWKDITTIAHTHRDEFYKASIAIEIDVYVDRED